MCRKFLILFLVLCICKLTFSIFGGALTRISKHPYQVSVRDKRDRDHICGGVIYSRQIVITAAHCVASRSYRYLRIRAGTKDRKNYGVIESVKQVILKPQYNAPTRSNDLALLILRKALPLRESIQPISSISDPQHVDIATFTGWGLNSEATQVLKEISLPILKNEQCCEYTNITQGMFCSGSPDAKVGPCTGDNGGPLVADVNGEKALVGILSFNPKGCAELGNPSVFTNVSHHLDWIKEFELK